MAAGKPVVATNTGGTPEAIVEGVTGYMAPAGDPGLLAQALLKLIGDKKLEG